MKVSFVTLGCRTNEAESRYMATEVAKLGFEVTLKLEKADIYVLNTCSITETADAKSRQLVARVLKLNNRARIYICGCSSENDRNAFNQPNVKCVFGTSNKFDIIKRLEKLAKTTTPKTVELPVRKLIKIEDGCNQFCSYCIVPYLRKKVESRTIEDILDEVNNTTMPEINFTGINLYLFSEGLTNLMHALKNTEKRVRLGSLDPRIIDVKFLKALKKIKNFCPQFHLSVQSLSNDVLKNMNRHYTNVDVIKKIKLIRKFFKNAFVACDIIVGFPGETDENFKETFEYVKKANFSFMHIFPYSVRKGTVASKMKQVKSNIKTERAKILQEVNAKNFLEFRKQLIKKTESLLIEEYKNGYSIGHSKNYIKCYLQEPREVGEVVNIQFLAIKEDGMLVKMLDK